MEILAMIMAGGESPGLGVLTAHRPDAALPFGGKYRIVDFALSNCVNSGIYNVAVLTQYQPRSLNEHIGIGKPWDLDRARGGVRIFQPYQSRRGERGSWQEGNADAVRFFLDYVLEQEADYVLILPGDHIYKLDYGLLAEFHAAHDADVTLGVRTVNPHDAHRFGMLALDDEARVIGFEEKPARSRSTLASMGIYLFKRDVLLDCLSSDYDRHDFGRDVIPALLPSQRVYACTFQGYWDDVGTIQSYWEANLALLAETPPLDLYDPEWVMHTRSEERPAAYIGAEARVVGNLLCDGCRIDGYVSRSVISPGVYVARGAVVRDSIVMNDSVIGAGAVIDRAIVDKEVVVGDGARVGHGDDNTPNRHMPQRLNTGITLVGKRTRIPAHIEIGRNVEIGPDLTESAFAAASIASGETVT
jgi:glucose-1-phosphate adenylyltransferase